jgi:hypothetical protein
MTFLRPPCRSVRVTNALSQPVQGVSVTFAALGAGARFANGDVVITATTGLDGVVAAPIAASATGSVQVEASIAGVYVPATFTVATVVTERRVYVPLLLRS